MQDKITKETFKGQHFFVGIDYHKKSWKVTILGKQYEHKTMSQDPSPELLSRYLHRNFPGGTYHAVYEAGFSGFGSCRRLRELGVDCMVIHPADVPTTQKERQQKTDKADSRKLARSLRSNEFEAIHVPERKLEADRALLRQRFRIVKDIARTKNRIKSLLFQFGIEIPERFTCYQTRHWSKNYIDWLKCIEVRDLSLKQVFNNYIDIGVLLRKKLLSANKQIRELSGSPEYLNNYKLLLSIPGVGPITAMTTLVQIGDTGTDWRHWYRLATLVQIGDIRRFKRLDDLCNYVGLVPKMNSSGDKTVVGKMTRRGRKELKIMMIESSWQAILKDPALMAKFNELSSRMNKNKAIIRIARKMLSRIRYVLLNNEEYELGVVK